MTTKAVIITYGEEQVLVEVEIRIPADVAARMHVNENMVLSALTLGKELKFFSRHNENKTIITPMPVCEIEHLAA